MDNLSKQQLDILQQSLDADAEGHLHPEDVFDWVSATSHAEARARMEEHLSVCASCRHRVDTMRGIVASLGTDELRDRQQHIVDAALGFARAYAAEPQSRVTAIEGARQRRLRGLPRFPAPEPARFAAAGTVTATGRVSNPSGEWQVRVLEDGQLEVTFAFADSKCEGAVLSLLTEPARHVTLTKVFGGTWMGRFVLPAAEWRTRRGPLVDRLVFADGTIMIGGDETENA